MEKKDGETISVGWIDIMCGFLQGYKYLAVGFCKSEIPIFKVLQEFKGCCMRQP